MSETKLSEKPYAFVPLQSVKVDDRISQNTRLKKGLVSGSLSFECLVVTPLHIGNGKLRLTTDGNNQEMDFMHTTVSSKDKPVIPGSSFKGMLRAVFETFTHSCMVFSPATRNKDLLNGIPRAMQGPCREEKACPACAVFGSLGWRGKIRIPDLELVDGKTGEIYVPTLKSPFADYPESNKYKGNARLYYAHKGNDGLDQDNRQPQPQFGDMSKNDFYKEFGWEKGPTTICFYGRKFYKLNITNPQAGQPNAWRKAQVVTRKSVFRGKIILEGLTQTEWEDLLIALGLGHDCWYHQLGQGKPAYYGTIKLRNFIFQPAKRFDDREDRVEVGNQELKTTVGFALKERDQSQKDALVAMAAIFGNSNGGPAWKEIEGGAQGLLGY
ncbi:MAG TPA: RAMP superfamily CRISPR-associated protein [Bacillota bacterium]|nr:RAMP superfamily CRISPR-associated protein [Bacillota bacterium]